MSAGSLDIRRLCWILKMHSYISFVSQKRASQALKTADLQRLVRRNLVMGVRKNASKALRLFVILLLAYHINNKSSVIAEIATQCCTSWIFAVEWGYLSLMHSFSVISQNIAMNRILPETRFFWLHSCRRQYGSNFNHHDVFDSRSYWIRWNNAK